MIDRIKRWWRYRKIKKCREDGHKPHTQTREGYRKPDEISFRTVAYAITQDRVVCKRCGEVLQGWETTNKTGLTSLTLSGYLMKEFNEEGEVWFSRGGL